MTHTHEGEQTVAISSLDELLRDFPTTGQASGITVNVEEVDPTLAAAWLEHNRGNRPLTASTVASYRRDMERGTFQYVGDPIRFSVDGTLLDGQYRLTALIEAGVTLPFIVIRGLPNESQSVMDIGKKRSTSDALAFLGVEGERRDLRDMTAIARSVLMLQNGTRPTQAEQVAFISENLDELREAARWVQDARAVGLRGGSLLGTAFHVLVNVDADAAEQFMEKVVDGLGLTSRRDPILLLRNRLLAGVPAGGARDLPSLRVNLAYVFKAWNAWREGREIGVLSYKAASDEKYPFPK